MGIQGLAPNQALQQTAAAVSVFGVGSSLGRRPLLSLVVSPTSAGQPTVSFPAYSGLRRGRREPIGLPLRRSREVDHLCSREVTHAKNTTCDYSARRSDLAGPWPCAVDRWMQARAVVAVDAGVRGPASKELVGARPFARPQLRQLPQPPTGLRRERYQPWGSGLGGSSALAKRRKSSESLRAPRIVLAACMTLGARQSPFPASNGKTSGHSSLPFARAPNDNHARPTDRHTQSRIAFVVVKREAKERL